MQAEISERRSERSFSLRDSFNGSRVSDNENGNSVEEGRNSPVSNIFEKVMGQTD